VLGVLLATIVLAVGTFVYFYVHYSRLIDAKLNSGAFAQTSAILASPGVLAVGDKTTAAEIADRLSRSGYTTSRTNTLGWYNERADGIEIYPGADSYFSRDEGAVIRLAGGKVTGIISLKDNTERPRFELEPELVTNLFDKKREKRRLVRFQDLPRDLIDAVVAIEDKRFFDHSGFDPLRIIKSAWIDVTTQSRSQGSSTLTMQLARGLWLTPEKTWSRKAAEAMITIHLENRLTKEEIFEHYANYVPLGRRGSFSIHGFGEAAQAYFGKDVKNLNLEECATLAALIQRPSYRNPFRWPERAVARRNTVLGFMLENKYIDDERYGRAKSSELVVSKTTNDSTDAPYFVDLVNDTLLEKFAEHEFQDKAYRVYTSIDMDLQRDATEAVRVGMVEVDKLIARVHKEKDGSVPEAQVALVALDAQTGELRALVGGRNYGQTQLNRGLAKRQPGSIFKPFVYAAALSTGLWDASTVWTTVSTIEDEPTKFYHSGGVYEPTNFHDSFHGAVSLRRALLLSLNIPTVKLGQAVGFGHVADIARRAGLAEQRGTPSVALGSYDATPIDMAGSYTTFANQGAYIKPSWVRMIRDDHGTNIFQAKAEKKQVIDPRVNYLMVNLMEDVLRSGTGAGVRARGFWQPAAGKTGTSRDGWFAGFTSRLICVVWVGFDDNRDLKLEGAKTALPVWTEFMKRAHQRTRYRNVQGFAPPDGIVNADVDIASGKLGQPGDEGVRTEVFIAGTEPVEVAGGRSTQVAGWDAAKPAGAAADVVKADAASSNEIEAATRQVKRESKVVRAAATEGQPVAPKAVPPKPADARKAGEKKAGFWGKVRDIFK